MASAEARAQSLNSQDCGSEGITPYIYIQCIIRGQGERQGAYTNDRLKHHEHEHGTRSATSGDLVQQTSFPSFIKKCATTFNRIRQITLSAKSKCAAKGHIRSFSKSI
jgi:hypothetical protein